MAKKVNQLAALAAALLLIAGCGDSVEKVATVNGEPITKDAFEAYLNFKRIPLQDEARKARALDVLVEREALAQEIAKTGVLDKSLVEAELDEFERELLTSRYFERHLQDAISEEGVRNFYAANASRYQAESVHVAHILIRVAPEMGEPERQAKLSTAHEAYSKLQQGEPFADVAQAYSEDALSAKKGGDLGWLKKGAVGPTFSENAFGLKPGTVSEPFLTPFGFHIVKVLDGPKTLTKPLEAVEGDIRYELRNEAKQAERDRLLKAAKIERKGS